MKAVQLVAHRRMEMVEMPEERDPAAGEVTVRLHACGICGSDLHWWGEGGVGARRAVYPCVLGHEPAGEIVAVGHGVETHRVGDRVAVEPALTCGACEFCRSGRHNLCTAVVFLSSNGAPGLYRDYATIPAANADLIPAEFSYGKATLIEPLSVIAHVYEMAPVPVGGTVAIAGAGPIGLLAAAVAKAQGAARVMMADRVAHRRALARRMGADEAVETERFAEAVTDATGGRGADLVIDAAAKQETLQAAFAVARRGASLVLVGIPSERNMRVDLHAAMAKEIRLQTIFRANHGSAQAIEWLRSGAVPDVLLTHTMPLERTQEAFEMLEGYEDGAGKVVMTW
jgi:L-iditol 2-dehydrogenase